MKRLQEYSILIALFALAIAAFPGATAAQRASDRQTRDLVRTLDSQVDDIRFAVEYDADYNAATTDRANLVRSLDNLRQKIAVFNDNFLARRENRDDIAGIVTAAKDVDAALRAGNTNRKIDTDWAATRKTIDALAGKYGVVVDWTPRISNAAAGIASDSLTGTYRLDAIRSEKIADIIAASNTSGENRRDLETKLTAPEIIALEIRGNRVTLATSNAAPVTFIADGREQTEQNGGRAVRLRATLRNNNELVISSLGGDTDYTITFTLIDSGRSLRVTRRITTSYLAETIFADSIYTRTDTVATLGITSDDDVNYSSSDSGPATTAPRNGRFLIASGTVLTAILDSTIDTSVSQNNDRFRMIVQTPLEYRGAVIEGFLSGVGRSGRVSGRANVTFNFDSITLRNGEKYDFAGLLQSVKDQNGKLITVDTEGTAKSESQTKETAKRGGAGAGLGAIIGAIASGPKGAILGAIIGGGAAAGSVFATGRDDVKLLPGSTFTIEATAPNQPQTEN